MIGGQHQQAGGDTKTEDTAPRVAAFGAGPSLVALIVLAVGFRLSALFLLRYGGAVPDWSDFRYYHELAALSAQGFYPDIHFWVEYPPLFPWLAVGAYQLSLQIPSWIHPYFWFDLILTTILAAADAGSIVLIDRLGDAFWGKPAGRRSATVYAAMFLPTFAVLGWFDTLPTFFLLLALDSAVSSFGAKRRRGFALSTAAGVATGIGAMLKLFPLLALPAVLVGAERRSVSGSAADSSEVARESVPTPVLPVDGQGTATDAGNEGTATPRAALGEGVVVSGSRGTGKEPSPVQSNASEPRSTAAESLRLATPIRRSNAPLGNTPSLGEALHNNKASVFDGSVLFTTIAVVATILTVAAIAAPFLTRSPDTFLATFRNVLARGSWMSPWALLDGYYETGGVASLHDRLFYNASALWGQPTRYAAIWWLVAALGGAVYAWRWWIARQRGGARAAIAITGFGVTVLLLLSRGFSTQFTVWLLPFVALILPGAGGAILATLLTLDDVVLEGYLYVTLFPTVHRLLWISVAVRTVLLLWFALECAVAVNPKASARFAAMRRRALVPALGLGLAGVVVAFATVAPSVQAAMLARNGDGPVVAAIGQSDAAAAVVFTQPDLFDRLAADLRPHPTVLVSEPGLLTWTGDRSLYHRLESSLNGRETVLLVTDPSQPTSPLGSAVTTWLEAHYGAEPDQKVGSLVLREYSKSRLPPERVLQIQFGDAITLAGMRPATLTRRAGDAVGAPLSVTLLWQASQQVGNDYTVSLQLLDPAGKLIAQHDAMPSNNTLPTSTWQPGQLVADRIDLTLPTSLAPGSYQLIVVLYDHQTLQRLSVHGPPQTGDHAMIGTVDVR